MFLPERCGYENGVVENIQLAVLFLGMFFALRPKVDKKFFYFIAMVLGILLIREVNCGRTIFFAIPGQENAFYSWKEIKYGWLAHIIYGFYMGLVGVYFLANKLFVTLWQKLWNIRLPFWNFVSFDKFIIVILFMGFLSIIVSYFSIKGIINEPASAILKPRAPKSFNSSFIERLKILKRLSFNIRWNYRDAKRNKFRSIMTLMGVIGCTVLLVSGFGVYEQMDNSKNWYFNEVNNFESKLIIDGDVDASQIDAIADNVNGDKIMESTIEVLTDDTHLASLQVLDGTDLITITNDNHEKMEISNDEVSISQKIADLSDVEVGDSFNFSIVVSKTRPLRSLPV